MPRTCLALLTAGHLPDSRPEPLCDLVGRLVRPEMSNAIQMRAVALVRRVAGSETARSPGAAGVLVPLLKLIWPILLRPGMPAVAEEAKEAVRDCLAVAEARARFGAELLPMLSGGYLKQLLETVATADCGAQALSAWTLVIDAVGASLQKTSIINDLLKVVEVAFRSANYDLRRRCFVAWRSLVANFLSSGRLHENTKRLKLPLMPLSTPNTARPAVAKFRAWWALLVGLGFHLSVTFDTTTELFLRFCYVPAERGRGEGARDRLGSTLLQLAEARPLARAALVHLLSPGCRQFDSELVPARQHETLTGAVFSRHAALLADSAAACLWRAPADGLAAALFDPLLDCATRHLESQASQGLTREQGLPVAAVIRALDTLLTASLESPVDEQVRHGERETG